MALGDDYFSKKQFGQAHFHYRFAHILKPHRETFSRLASVFANQNQFDMVETLIMQHHHHHGYL